MISLNGVSESRTSLTPLSRALFGHSELRLERMICYQLIDFVLSVSRQFLTYPSYFRLIFGGTKAPFAGSADEIHHLGHIEQHTHPRHCQHEHSEYGLFCWSGDKTVHGVGARVRVTFHQTHHLKVRVDQVKDVKKSHLEDDSEDDTDHVCPPQGSCDLKLLVLDVIQLLGTGATRSLQDLLVDVPSVGDMHGHQQCGGGDQDELECPQADVRDGEELVVANAVAAGLLGVAGEAGLLIPPNTLCSDHQDQDTEDEDDGEPNASDAG